VLKRSKECKSARGQQDEGDRNRARSWMNEKRRKRAKRKKRERISMQKNGAIRAGVGGKRERDNM